MIITCSIRRFADGMGERMQAFHERVRAMGARTHARAICGVNARLRDARGQGTTEYAILVGVLVVIAMLAITVFKP